VHNREFKRGCTICYFEPLLGPRYTQAQTDGTAVSNPQLSRQTQKAAEFFMPVLRVENLQDMQEDIPFNSLSRTFQEAIFTTRRLGFRYLWIDSLCIIQDSREDWRKESVLMSTVYSGSQLNLAATSARNGTEGYFRDRNPSLVQPCKVRARTTGHGEGLFDCVDLNIWKKGVEESPLGLRGWVLQERVLAPRTLHFGETQMFWSATNYVPVRQYRINSISKSIGPALSLHHMC